MGRKLKKKLENVETHRNELLERLHDLDNNQEQSEGKTQQKNLQKSNLQDKNEKPKIDDKNPSPFKAKLFQTSTTNIQRKKKSSTTETFSPTNSLLSPISDSSLKRRKIRKSSFSLILSIHKFALTSFGVTIVAA